MRTIDDIIDNPNFSLPRYEDCFMAVLDIPNRDLFFLQRVWLDEEQNNIDHRQRVHEAVELFLTRYNGNHHELFKCAEYREARLHECFCEVVGLSTASEDELKEVLADQRADNERHQQRMEDARATFFTRYGWKAN